MAKDIKPKACEVMDAEGKRGEKALYVQIDRKGVLKDETMAVLTLKKSHKNYKGNYFYCKRQSMD